MQHGYEPLRLHELTQRSRGAVAALDGIGSTDPAAADAMAALARLEAVVANDMISATAAVGLTDPLGGPTGRFQVEQLRPQPRSAYERWMDEEFPSSPFGATTDEELLAELISLGDDAPFEARFDPDHPHWDGFGELADELARRSVEADSDAITAFGQLLIDNVWMLPALPVAIAIADFDPGFSAEALAMVFHPAAANSAEVHRTEAFGADLILASLLEHPDAVAALLERDVAASESGAVRLDDTFLFRLLDSDVVDQQILGEVIGSVLDPAGPVALAVIERSLTLFVQAANDHSFERGFSEPVSLALASALVDLFPQLKGQIRLNQPIYFDEILDDEAILLGEYDDVRDFIGAIIVNPSGMVLLFAVGAGSHDIVLDDSTARDVQAFAELLREAFGENLDEIAIASSRNRSQWNIFITALSTAVGAGAIGKALGPVGVRFAEAAIERFGTVVTQTSDASSGQDVGFLAQIMILFGSYEGFLDQHDRRGIVDTARARDKLAEAWEQFEAGDPLGVVAETLGDVAEEIESLGGSGFIDHDVARAIEDIDPFRADSDL